MSLLFCFEKAFECFILCFVLKTFDFLFCFVIKNICRGPSQKNPIFLWFYATFSKKIMLFYANFRVICFMRVMRVIYFMLNLWFFKENCNEIHESCNTIHIISVDVGISLEWCGNILIRLVIFTYAITFLQAITYLKSSTDVKNHVR